MKIRRRVMIPTIAILVIALSVIIICVIFHTKKQGEVSQAQQNLEQLLEQGYADAGEPENVGGQIAKILYEKTSYQIVSADDKTCKVKLTYPNAGKLLIELSNQIEASQEANSDNQDVDELLNEILLRIQKNEIEWVTTTVKTSIIDGAPVINDDITNAFYGGLISSYNEILAEYMNEEAE